MKKLICLLPMALLALSSASFASGGGSCELTVTVKDVRPLDTLDQHSRIVRNGGVDTYQYVATLDVTSSRAGNRPGGCQLGERLIVLQSKDQVQVGQELVLDYGFMHDRNMHSSAYIIRK